MTMPRGERAVIAGFKTMEAAQQASQELTQMHVLDMQIERISEQPASKYERRPENAITGHYPGLASGVYDRDMDRDTSVLASSHPSASGMSDGSNESGGTDVLLTVVVQEADVEQVRQVIEQHGGQL